MLPAIYSTYGVAMGHRPEVLGESGGLRPPVVCVQLKRDELTNTRLRLPFHERRGGSKRC
jgi:hypothetical protein